MLKSLYLPIIIVSAILAFKPASADEAVKSTYAAKINGVPVTKSELFVRINKLLPQASYHGKVLPEKRKDIENKAIQELIDEELLFQEAKRQDLQAESSLVSRKIDEIAAKYPTKEAFVIALKKYNTSLSMLKQEIKKVILVKEIIRKETEITLSDKDLSDYYHNNKEQFIMPESVRLLYIFIKIDPSAPDFKEKAETKAKEVLSKLESGTDFAEIALKYSDDMSRVKGGDIGFVHKGRMPEEIEKAAFLLKQGEISDIIETFRGYHIIKTIDKKPPKQMSFEDIKGSLKNDLTASMKKKNKTGLIDRLRKSAVIDYY